MMDTKDKRTYSEKFDDEMARLCTALLRVCIVASLVGALCLGFA